MLIDSNVLPAGSCVCVFLFLVANAVNVAAFIHWPEASVDSRECVQIQHGSLGDPQEPSQENHTQPANAAGRVKPLRVVLHRCFHSFCALRSPLAWRGNAIIQLSLTNGRPEPPWRLFCSCAISVSASAVKEVHQKSE